MTLDNEDRIPSEPSRSALKRAAKAVEELAEQLAVLPSSQRERLSPPKEIEEELKLVAKAAAHGARKRQIKHLAALLRREEAWTARLREFLEGVSDLQYQDQKRFHQLEQLRDQLCDAEKFPAALAEIEALFPAADRERLTRLAGAIHSSIDKRAYREIFQLLKAASETPPE